MNLQMIYEELKLVYPNISDNDLKRMAWVKRDQIIYERGLLTSGSKIEKFENDYVENDYVDPDYVE
jgi:hypothetical protein